MIEDSEAILKGRGSSPVSHASMKSLHCKDFFIALSPKFSNSGEIQEKTAFKTEQQAPSSQHSEEPKASIPIKNLPLHYAINTIL